MEKGYLIEDLQKILGKERTQTLRFAKAQGWKVKKIIIDKRQEMYMTPQMLMLIELHY